jgi:predicted AlkP superfamily phosphohydrolase/phosphomutase
VTGATFLSYQDVDWARTRAVAMGYLGQVFLNVRGHRPAGVIPTADYEAERRKLRELLEGLEDPRDGRPVVDRVCTREEIYSGPALTDAPDLIVHLREGYSGESGIAGGGKLVAPSPDNHSSDHWNESVFLALGPGLCPGEIRARLEDVAPTVLHALGVDPSPGCDGKVLPIFSAPG